MQTPASAALTNSYTDVAIETKLGSFVVQLDRARARLQQVLILKTVLLQRPLD
ncbi:MAG: hypothetical protein ACRETQ_01835 [Gammaproteobacteria bacterium]